SATAANHAGVEREIAPDGSGAAGPASRSGRSTRPAAHSSAKRPVGMTTPGYPDSADSPHRAPASTAGHARRERSAAPRRQTAGGRNEYPTTIERWETWPTYRPLNR